MDGLLSFSWLGKKKGFFFFLPLIENIQSPDRCRPACDDIIFDWSISLVQILYSWSVWGRGGRTRDKVTGVFQADPGRRKRKRTSGRGLAPPRGRGSSSLSVPEIKSSARLFRHCSIFNPSTLDTSLLTLSCCLWSRPSPRLPSPPPAQPTPSVGAQTGLATGGSNSGHPPNILERCGKRLLIEFLWPL